MYVYVTKKKNFGNALVSNDFKLKTLNKIDYKIIIVLLNSAPKITRTSSKSCIIIFYPAL